MLLLPTISDVVTLVRLAIRRPRDTNPSGTTNAASPPNLLFLVPAHDEELLIEACLRSLTRLRYPAERMTIVVVADNCTDRTADLARRMGVRCLERHDVEQRGKPWAIAWALDRLALGDHQAIVIVDADSIVDPGFAAALAAAAPLEDRAVQAYNDVGNRTENALTRMATVLSTARFRFMNAVKRRASLNVPLANGLCIGTGVLARHGWTAFSICEDWELYAILTERGVSVASVPDARIYSQEASSLTQSSSQRRRWTAGRIAVLARYAWPLGRSSRIGAHQKVDAFGELTAPGPAVQLGVVALLSAIALLLHVPGAPWIVAALWLSIARTIVYTLAALRVDIEPGRATMAFAFLPVYTIWRLGVQLTAVVASRRTPWIRTDRRA